MADLLSVAQAMQPRALPNFERGGSGIAGMMYGQDTAAHRGMLEQAAQQAQMEAAVKAASAGEQMAGAPGRMDAISLGNLKAKKALGSFEEDSQRDDTIKQEELFNKLAPYLNEMAGEDEEKAKKAYEDMTELYPQLKKVPYDRMRSVSQTRFGGQVRSPAHVQKTELEDTKGGYKLSQEFMKQQGATTRQERDLIMRREVAKIKASNPKLHDLLLQKNGGDLQAMFNDMLLLKVAPGMQQGQNAADMANAILPPDKQIPQPRPIQQGVTSGTSTTATPKFNTGQIYKDKDGNRAKYMGKDKDGKDKWEPVR